MVANFLAGGAAATVFAATLGVPVRVVDAGVAGPPIGDARLIDRRIGRGHRQLPARAGDDARPTARGRSPPAARWRRRRPGEAAAFGEMGIGNTASAAAVAHKLTGLGLAALVGRGTGLDDAGLARKRAVLAAAAARTPAALPAEAALAEYGGFEIAMMAGAMLGAAAAGQLVLVDGFIATVAALAAEALEPGARAGVRLRPCLGRGRARAAARPHGRPPAARARHAARRGHRGAARLAAGARGGGDAARHGELRERARQRPGMSRLAEEWAALRLALRFLTRLPLPDPGPDARMAASPRWYPAVGVLVGALAARSSGWPRRSCPPALAALVATAAGLLLTGALHEDGLADVCDGLGGGATRERALEIMRDSRIGTYGAAGLGVMLAAKVLALAALPVAAVPLALIAGHAASRASMVVVVATASYVRPEGMATPIAGGLAGAAVALATATRRSRRRRGCPRAAGDGGRWRLLGLAAGHGLMRSRFERRLGGYTGDCLGAVQQTSEIGFYLGVLACL